jgi:hypothetical protein
MRTRIEQVGAAFIGGYHSALEQVNLAGLEAVLASVPLEQRGFAFEGATMGLALLDGMAPWSRSRVKEFLQGAGEPHTYMVHVGAGWAWARLPFSARRARRRLDPLLQWLAFDGWGFHEGFFHWPRYIGGREAPARLVGYERRAFDQGLGRSWWFVNGGDPQPISRTIGGFGPERQGDMWSGIGLAAAYAGLASEEALESLCREAGQHRPHLAQGAAFAAKARQRAGNLTEYTDLALHTLAGLSTLGAASLCDSTLENLPANGVVPAYEVWKRRIQAEIGGQRSESGGRKGKCKFQKTEDSGQRTVASPERVRAEDRGRRSDIAKRI